MPIRKYIIGALLFIVAAVILLWASQKEPHVRSIRQNALQKARMTTLNYFIPDFRALILYNASEKMINEADLSKYEHYYSLVQESMPALPEAYHMLGFCALWRGNLDKAISFYQKSIELNPKFFWSYYNLGLILYKIGRVEEAAILWSSGLNLDPRSTIESELSSTLFLQIFRSQGLDSKELLNLLITNLAVGYKNAHSQDHLRFRVF